MKINKHVQGLLCLISTIFKYEQMTNTLFIICMYIFIVDLYCLNSYNIEVINLRQMEAKYMLISFST